MVISRPPTIVRRSLHLNGLSVISSLKSSANSTIRPTTTNAVHTSSHTPSESSDFSSALNAVSSVGKSISLMSRTRLRRSQSHNRRVGYSRLRVNRNDTVSQERRRAGLSSGSLAARRKGVLPHSGSANFTICAESYWFVGGRGYGSDEKKEIVAAGAGVHGGGGVCGGGA